MRLLPIILALTLFGSPASANNQQGITIINQSSYTVNKTNLLKVSKKYKEIVLKYWAVDQVPITIYLVDNFQDNPMITKGHVAYHWYEDNPFIYISMNRLKANREVLSLVLTHELGESIVNPYLQKYTTYKNRRVPIEISDPTNDIFYIGKTPVSDFAFPAFYDIKAKGPYSYTRSLLKPFEPNSIHNWRGIEE
jgi:hypothetical protein